MRFNLHFFRGNKADNGARFGCAGVIIFSDPAEAAQEGTEPENVSQIEPGVLDWTKSRIYLEKL